MNFCKIIILIWLYFGGISLAQNRDTIVARPLSQYPLELIQKDEFGNRYYYDTTQKAKIYEINGEVVVVMDELVLEKKPTFNNQLDRNYYFFLNKKLDRVYPLFLKALEQYTQLKAKVDNLEPNDKRKISYEIQSELADQYEDQMKDLTTTEGQVFAKLMCRATGKTVYTIIKELRGGWSAFWWNIKGNVADIELKKEYNPHKYRDDEFLEALLQTNWKLGNLEPYPGYKNFKISR